MYNLNYEFFAPKGWICPKCGRVYNPYTNMCPYCNNFHTNTSINDDEWWKKYLRESVTFPIEDIPFIHLVDYDHMPTY